MKKVKITVIRKTCCPDLMEKYENPVEHVCDIQERQVDRQWVAEAGGDVRQCMGEHVGLCDDAGTRWRRFLRRMDEEPKVGYDKL